MVFGLGPQLSGVAFNLLVGWKEMRFNLLNPIHVFAKVRTVEMSLGHSFGYKLTNLLN